MGNPDSHYDVIHFNISILGLLDLTAAFDTIDHDILLKRLEKTYGIKDTALKWFTSYVSNRSQTVLVDGILSNPATLSYGVPQGSVLGPILFTMYTKPLSKVIEDNQCSYHKYADDTELTSSSSPSSFPKCKAEISKCTDDIFDWMSANKLKLNREKNRINESRNDLKSF